MQRFIAFDPEQHYFTLEGARDDDFRRVALFDLVVNNADRKGGHCLLASDGTIWVVDHGVCFHEEPKLRTVIWDVRRRTDPGHVARGPAPPPRRPGGAAACATS